MTTLELLKTGREIIADPNKWCQHAFAVDVTGRNKLSSQDPRAVKWCSLGILFKLSHYASSEVINAVRLLWQAASIDMNFSKWQDSHTHQEVMAAWDRAIQLAEQTEQAG